ncbi:MAG: hypothetical protein IAE79_26780 [Anaerolinea sp.]|nr:hypothetical protein [Anaerolinea sp.]
MLLRAPTKVALTLLYLLLLTACGGAAEQPAAPLAATPTPLPVAADGLTILGIVKSETALTR